MFGKDRDKTRWGAAAVMRGCVPHRGVGCAADCYSNRLFLDVLFQASAARGSEYLYVLESMKLEGQCCLGGMAAAWVTS